MPAAETHPLLNKASPRALREELLSRVLRDLHGPAGGPEEILTESNVRDRYLIGTLAPRSQELPAEENDRLDGGAGESPEDGKADDDSAGRPALLPSSIGLTFGVGDVDAIDVTVRYGRYTRVKREELVEDVAGDEKLLWKRVPVQATHRLAIKEGPLDAWSPDDDPERQDIRVQGLARRREGHWAVTLFLVNGQRVPKQGRVAQDTFWLFQVELEVAGPDAAPIFVSRPLSARRPSPSDQDEAIVEMTYRDVQEFAVGHGVGVEWESDQDDPTRARRLVTRSAPTYEVSATRAPSKEQIPALAGVELDMGKLADTPSEGLSAKLLPLVEAYESWIAAREDEKHRPEARLAGLEFVADQALDRCRAAALRIREGIETISRDPDAAEAFRFMNRAMGLQRVRSKLAQARRRRQDVTFEALDVPENRTWYPFQLAFVLLNVPSAADLHHRDRGSDPEATADLLWFPTGGGKTEAYLGVATFVMAIRRLQGAVGGRRGDAGLAVLMRYTLRLLTLQQFQRATALICACEHLRREALEAGDSRWGEVPFRIGLWVGQKVTPNWTEQAHDAVVLDHGDGFKGGGPTGRRTGSPHQLLSCPWCGTTIVKGRDIKVKLPKSDRGRTLTFCGDPLGDCLFSARRSPDEGLPVLVVDEEIYRNPPTLMIATVDKFAQMPWKGELQTLFGTVAGHCQRHGFRSPDLEDADSHTKRGALPAARTVPTPMLRPPDLIIQDELHLISGPLGSLVGLYETAVDKLCTWEVDGRLVRPKIIASTATVRRAREQVWQVFQRSVAVFPPPGLSVRDNFFSRQLDISDDAPGRLYLGICATGRRMKSAYIRVFVAAMAAAQSLYEEFGVRADPWMTAVGYFNSMRELGGMRRLVDDDVASRLRRMDKRGLAKRYTDPGSLDELTSRKGSTDIPKILDRLEVPFDPQALAERERRRKAGEKNLPPRPLDVVLATNMISVGVDISRLGLMIVGGQPKNTAEYIQATSRVGREHPGLVITVYNWSRPRDISHYERFVAYHASFYKQVEALSVTPFAPRARDRALFPVLVALVRLGALDFNGNGRAGTLSASDPRIRDAQKTMVDRAQAVTCAESVASAVRRRLERLIDDWRDEAQRASPGHPLGYKEGKETKGLLKTPDHEDWGTFTCLTSLRDVEPTVSLILQDDPILDRPPEWTAVKQQEST